MQYDVCIEACENYQKRSFRNRTSLPNVNGLIHLSIPLKKGKNHQMPIRKVEFGEGNWRMKIWRTIKSAYGKSPYFFNYKDELKALILKNDNYLFDYNMALLKFLLHQLVPTFQMRLSTTYIKGRAENIIDLRNTILPSSSSKPVEHEFYPQVFEDRLGFIPNCSALDLLLCMGPEGAYILR